MKSPPKASSYRAVDGARPGLSGELPNTRDIDGDPRVLMSEMDRGADEFSVVEFIRGDANGDGVVQLGDPIEILGHLFLSVPARNCDDALDVDDTESLNLNDPIFLLNHLFIAGNPPPFAPFPDCGLDPTTSPDNLFCPRDSENNPCL